MLQITKEQVATYTRILRIIYKYLGIVINEQQSVESEIHELEAKLEVAKIKLEVIKTIMQ